MLHGRAETPVVHPLYTEVLDTAATITSTTFFRSGLVVLRTVSERKRQSEDYSVSETFSARHGDDYGNGTDNSICHDDDDDDDDCY